MFLHHTYRLSLTQVNSYKMKGITVCCACIILAMLIAVGDGSPMPREKSGSGHAGLKAKAAHPPTGKSAGTSVKEDASAGKPSARCFGLDLFGGLWPWGEDSSDYSSSDYDSDERKSDKGKKGRSETVPKTQHGKSKIG